MVSTLKSARDAESRGQKNTERNPETTIGRKSRSTERIPGGEFPHTGKELRETAYSVSHMNGGVGLVDVSCVDIYEGEEESRGCERDETAEKKGTREYGFEI